MSKLIKYEFRKTWVPKLILLGITAALEIAYLICIFADDLDWAAFFALLLTLTAIGGIFMIGLTSLVILHRDINTRQSYMLFMTPNSGYKIMGAKVLENGLSLLITGAFFFALGALDITLLFGRVNGLEALWELITDAIHAFNHRIQIDGPGVACFIISLLATWFAVVNAAFLADVISAALLRGKKVNGLLTFVLGLALIFAVIWLQSFVSNLLLVDAADTNPRHLLQSLVALVLAGFMYVATSEIMDRKLSV